MLRAESLACRRGRRIIFRDVSFAVNAGDVLRITGRNGSGKTSLLRLLAGFLPVFGGALYWNDKVVTDATAYRTYLHYIGHLDALKPELTAGETISYWRTLRSVTASPDVLEPFGLAELADRPVRYFSAGQKRRLVLARLSVTDAPLWLLDEPLTALDQKGQLLLASLIAAHQAKGGMIVIATHHDLDFENIKILALDGAAG